MIVVDTNVLSEPLRPHPEARVLEWLSAHRAETAITTITLGELRYGAARVPIGRRRVELEAAIERLALGADARLLDYDERASAHYARLRAAREAAGRTGTVEDLMIAAICLATGATLATRNVKDFIDSGVPVIDPWAA